MYAILNRNWKKKESMNITFKRGTGYKIRQTRTKFELTGAVLPRGKATGEEMD